MGSVNKVILIGNLGADPELKYTPSNRAVCTFSLATNEVFKDKAGVRQERTEWHRIVVWGEQGEACAKYLVKGRSSYVEGRLHTRSWEEPGGRTRYSTEIIAERVVFLASGGIATGNNSSAEKTGEDEPNDLPPAPPDDDIPF
jgi:single-strand DNA-binding protein